MRLLFFIYCFILIAGSKGNAYAQVQNNSYEKDTATINALIAKGTSGATAIADAKQILLQTLSTSRQKGYKEGIVKSLAGLGRRYSEEGSFKKALEYYTQSLRYYDSISQGKAKLYAGIFYSTGTAYQSLGDFNNAGTFYIKAAQEASKDTSLNRSRAYIYSSLGGVFIQLKEYNKALHYFNLGQNLALQAKDDKALGHVYSNKGIYYEEHNNFDSAYHYYIMALRLSEANNDKRTQLTTLSNIGALYMKQKQYEKAIPYFEKTLQLAGPGNLYVRLNGALYFLGAAHYYLKHYSQSEKYLLIALKEAEAVNQPEMSMDVHALLATVYAATKEFEKAYNHQKHYEALKDTLSGSDAVNNVNALETKYRTAQKDKQIAEKKLEIAQQQIHLQQKNKWIWISSVIGVLLLGLLGMLYRVFVQKQRLYSEKVRSMQQEKEIELLQAMMAGEEKERIRLAHELHDGISSQISAMKFSLASISNRHHELAENEDFQQVIAMLNETGSDIRKTAHNLMPDSLIRQGLVDATRHFCEQIHTNANIEFQAYGDFEDLSGTISLLVYRIIQELLNNIIKHANASQAIILLYRDGNKLQLTVEDNGIGMKPKKEAESGMGLSSLETKIRSVNGVFTIESIEGKGTTVYIELNLENEKKIILHEDTDSHY